MLDTVVYPLIGGVLIGLAASVLLLFNGRVAGISGIVQGSMSRLRGDNAWRLIFVGSMLSTGVVLFAFMPERFDFGINRNYIALIVGGLLVGFGTRLGSGCTSGHGVCGLSRFSKRSLVAVAIFMGTALATVALTHAWLEGV